MYLRTMYKFKKGLDVKINRTKASEEIGISRNYIKDILNGKRSCSLIIAKSIRDYIDKNQPLEYFFEKENN